MFKRLAQCTTDTANTVTVTIEGQPCQVLAGDTVAAAVLAQGIGYTRTLPLPDALPAPAATPTGPTPVQHRAPFCMMGVCFECLMEIDGIANRQACKVRVVDGMSIRRQHGAGIRPAGHSDED